MKTLTITLPDVTCKIIAKRMLHLSSKTTLEDHCSAMIIDRINKHAPENSNDPEVQDFMKKYLQESIT